MANVLIQTSSKEGIDIILHCLPIGSSCFDIIWDVVIFLSMAKVTREKKESTDSLGF